VIDPHDPEVGKRNTLFALALAGLFVVLFAGTFVVAIVYLALD
jgi:hypothetical protein